MCPSSPSVILTASRAESSSCPASGKLRHGRAEWPDPKLGRVLGTWMRTLQVFMPRSSPWYICLCFQHLYSQLLWVGTYSLCVSVWCARTKAQTASRSWNVLWWWGGGLEAGFVIKQPLCVGNTCVSKKQGASLLSSCFRSLKKKKRCITNIPTQTCLVCAPSSKRYFTVAVGTSDPWCLRVTGTSIGFQPAVCAAQGPF